MSPWILENVDVYNNPVWSLRPFLGVGGLSPQMKNRPSQMNDPPLEMHKNSPNAIKYRSAGEILAPQPPQMKICNDHTMQQSVD